MEIFSLVTHPKGSQVTKEHVPFPMNYSEATMSPHSRGAAWEKKREEKCYSCDDKHPASWDEISILAAVNASHSHISTMHSNTINKMQFNGLVFRHRPLFIYKS